MWSMGEFARAAAVAASACLVLAATADAPAGDGAPPAKPTLTESAKALARFPEDLAALAAWCDRSGLAVERNRVAESILLFSPDDPKARAWLGFRSEGEGKWKRVPTPPPLDTNKDALAEWTSRRDALVAPLRGSVLRWATAPDPKFAGFRDRVIRTLVALAPEDREFRALNGETYAGGRWILNETAATAAGRRRIADAARDARKTAARAELKWTREPEWVSIATIGGFTMRSDFPKSDTEEMARAIVAARELLACALRARLGEGTDEAVFVFADYWTFKRFLENRSDLTDERRKWCMDAANFWIGGKVLVERDDSQIERVDGLVRQTISHQLTTFGRMYKASDWMGEGIGMYLTHALVGTRLTAFVQDTKYSDESLWRELSDARSDWVALARRMIERGYDPKIPVLVGTPLNSLTKDDGLMAYALAAYFLESRPLDAARLVLRTQDGTNFHQALAELCGIDAGGLDHRFQRWLRETK